MKQRTSGSPQSAPRAVPERSFEKTILRLVKGGPERMALEARQIDAIVDPASGSAILLPEAQQALLGRGAGRAEPIAIAYDWSWIQDESARFISHTIATPAAARLSDQAILGKALWDLGIDNLHDADWQAHRQQIAWRAPFRDLELRRRDRDGKIHHLAVSGEPLFDEQNRFKGYRGIVRRMAAARRIELHLLEHRRYSQRALDGLAIPVCLLDAAGIVMLANRAWHGALGGPAGYGLDAREGDDYVAACLAARGDAAIDGAPAAAGIRQVIAAERQHFRYGPAQASGPGGIWIELDARTIADGGRARAIVTLRDVTREKSAEKLLTLELAVARRLAEAAERDSGLQAVIQAICLSQSWECGRFLRRDTSAGVLRQVAAWGLSREAIQQFLDKSHGLVLRQDAGLAGRVVDSGQPVWSHDAAFDSAGSSMALPPEAGVAGSIFFPALHDGQTLGVFAFSSPGVGEPDERMLHTLRSIGEQVGLFLQRMTALEGLRRSASHYRKLTEISSDWHWEQDRDYRFTRIDGSGPFGARSALGLTHWELPDVVPLDPQWAEHRTRLAARWSFCDVEFSAIDSIGNRHRYLISGEPVYDDAGLFAGYRGTGLEVGIRRKDAALGDDDATR